MNNSDKTDRKMNQISIACGKITDNGCMSFRKRRRRKSRRRGGRVLENSLSGHDKKQKMLKRETQGCC